MGINRISSKEKPMVEKITELNLSKAQLPCLANGSARWKFADDFIIRCICHVEILGSRHTILSKRIPQTRGNRPGLMLHIHSARVELLTFGDNDKQWHCLVSKPKTIMAGERYEILAGRVKGKGVIYINGWHSVDFANNLSCDQAEDMGFTGGISQGDINCNEPVYLGLTHLENGNFWKFDGGIEFLGIYNNYELPKSLMRYKPRKTWMTQSEFLDRLPPNTKTTFTMKDLGFEIKDTI